MRFTKNHHWVELQDGVATVGVTAYAAEQLGDVISVELPDVGKALKAGEAMAVVESVEVASDVEAPLDGVVTAVNVDLPDHPDMVNEDPEKLGWLVKLKAADPSQTDAMMDRDAYEAFLDSL